MEFILKMAGGDPAIATLITVALIPTIAILLAVVAGIMEKHT